jgi:hypothetical protein
VVWKLKPAFFYKLNENEKGSPYWMSHISDGVRQYTIDVPQYFEILDLVKRKIFKYPTMLNHGKTIRPEYGENPVYTKMIHYLDTDYDFMSWYGFVADYIHAFQISSVVEVSNNKQAYEPLEAKLKDASKL